MTDIAVTLRPQQGIQCEENILYLFDPNVVVSITETTTRQWLDTESQNYINTYIKPILDAYEQDKEREIDAYVEEKQSTIFFDNTNLTGTTTAEVLNVTNSASFNDVTFTGSIDTSTATFTDVIKMRASVSFKGAVAPSWSGIGIYELNDDDSVSLMASMEKIDGFTPANNNTYNIGVNSRKWKDLYLAGKAYVPTINNGGDITVPTSAGTMALTSDLTNFADKDLSNLTSQGKNITNWSSNVSNCITEIPQDIKLELSSGTLTLKAGSKVYVPNGMDVFDTVTITNDMQISPTSYASSKYILCVLPNNTIQLLSLNTQQYSGSTPPSGQQYMFWYDTTNNYVKYTTDSGSTWQSGWCLPLAIVMITNGTGVTSIDQIFNGFGYMGSTVFALPGVKGLIPNGRNEDGSLKSIESIITVVKVKTLTNNVNNFPIGIDSQGNFVGPSDIFQYDSNSNYLYYQNVKRPWIIIGIISFSSNNITNFNFKSVFHALDYNDTSYIASQSFPSDKYIDLTLGASGTTYIAPTDGYIQMIWNCGSGTSFITVDQPFNADQIVYNTNYTSVGKMFLVRKGNFIINYTNVTVTTFRFVYARGNV